LGKHLEPSEWINSSNVAAANRRRHGHFQADQPVEDVPRSISASSVGNSVAVFAGARPHKDLRRWRLNPTHSKMAAEAAILKSFFINPGTLKACG
jgi:hypothetical protein